MTTVGLGRFLALVVVLTCTSSCQESKSSNSSHQSKEQLDSKPSVEVNSFGSANNEPPVLRSQELSTGSPKESTSHRQKLLGDWYFPHNEASVLGYTSLLRLRPDSTFTKIQSHRLSYATFEGTYQLQDDGRLILQLKKKSIASDFVDDTGKTYPPSETKVDIHYRCKFEIDPKGYLVLDAKCINLKNEDIGIRWEKHARETNYVIRGREK